MRWYYIAIIFVSLLPLVSIFATSDLFHSHDGLVHLPRIAAYHKALLDGQFPVRWAGDLNYQYGMPIFNFIYQLPYFIASFFIFLGLGLVNAFKVSLAGSYILSGIFMFAFAKSFFRDEKKALLVAVAYQFAPFRLVELLVRGSFGEVYTYTFLPLVFFGLTNLISLKDESKQFQYRYFLLSSAAAAFLILSHNSISLLFFGICIGFVLIFSRNLKALFLGLSSLLLGLLLSAFYWMPAILEHKYTYGDLFMKDLYKTHFAPLQNFFLPNFTNSSALQIGGISIQIGIFHLIAVFLSFLLLVKVTPLSRWHLMDRFTRRLIIFCLVLVVVSFFFMQPISIFLWERISFLRQFQFPWRFLSIVVFATSLCVVSFLSFPVFKKKWVYVGLLLLIIGSTVYYWRPNLGYDKINEEYYWNFPLNTTYYGETDVIWSEGPARSYPKNRVDVIKGKGGIKDYMRKSNIHTYTVFAQTPVGLVDHTEYFPGWRVYVDNKQVPIQFQDPNHRGELTFTVPGGTHEVKVIFRETAVRLVAEVLSLLSFIVLIFIGMLL